MSKGLRLSLVAAACGLGAVMTASAAESAKSFLKDAADDSRAEVQMSQLALQKAQRPEVKQFAQRMVDDHTALNKQIEALAQKKNIKLSDSLPLTKKASYEKLSHTNDNFDKDFMDKNVSDHQDDFKKFSEEAKSGDDPDVKAFASEVLPKFQEHLKLAKDLQAKLK